MTEKRKCEVCEKSENLSKCSRCQNVLYCSRQCQIQDWKTHKKECKTNVKKEVIKYNWVDLSGDGGVMKHLIQEGRGRVCKKKSRCRMKYVGRFESGKIFDESEEFNFRLNSQEVIQGWDIGVGTMKKGEKCFLKCLPEYAYADDGYKDENGKEHIPPDTTLIFEIEMLYFK